MSALSDFLAEQADIDLQLSRRTLAISQAAWDAEARSIAASAAIAKWHGSKAHKETGAVAVVSLEAPFSELIGEIIRVSRVGGVFPPRSVIVYVVDRLDIEADISLSRRAFHELGLLANEYLSVRVEVLT